MSSQPVVIQTRSSPNPEPFVGADTAAAFVGLSRRTLLEKVRAGKLPGHPLDPCAKKKDWRFKLSELDRCLRSTVSELAHAVVATNGSVGRSGRIFSGSPSGPGQDK